MRTLNLTVSAPSDGCIVENLLSRELCLSKSLISRLKRRQNGICVNGEPAYVTRILHAGDVLSVVIGDPPGTRRAAPMHMPLDILYEDADILILNKPAGVTVHADNRKPDELTLDNALSAYLPADAFPHPVSRLDRGTTGVMTYAKNGYMHERLRRILHTPDFTRAYLAVAEGAVDPPEGVIELPIGFAAGSTYQRAVTEDGIPARTEYRTLRTGNGRTLLTLTPCTGRTHQLRVHMAAIGYPLTGDWLYGTRDAHIDRPALHSHTLRLVHPLTGCTLNITAPPPPDFDLL